MPVFRGSRGHWGQRGNVIIRHHRQFRPYDFTPANRNMQVEISKFQDLQRTVVFDKDGRASRSHVDNWKKDGH
eukprot:11034853-Lingulodinium_polyedra.AAC.1